MAGRPLTRFREQLPPDWPDLAVREAYDQAVRLNAAMTGDWPVWDVERDNAIDAFNEWVRAELRVRDGMLEQEASDAWIAAWEDGDTDAPLRAAFTWYHANH